MTRTLDVIGSGRGEQRLSLLSDDRLPLALFICMGGGVGSDRETECYSPAAVHHSREREWRWRVK